MNAVCEKNVGFSDVASGVRLMLHLVLERPE